MPRAINLTRAGAGCELVNVRTKHANVPIGGVCKVSGGYEWRAAPNRGYQGPTRTKAAAVLKVVRGHASWVGYHRLGDYFDLAGPRRRH